MRISINIIKNTSLIFFIYLLVLVK